MSSLIAKLGFDRDDDGIARVRDLDLVDAGYLDRGKYGLVISLR